MQDDTSSSTWGAKDAIEFPMNDHHGGEMRPLLGTPPRDSGRQQPKHHPPLSVVVVRGTPPSAPASATRSLSSVGSSRPFHGASMVGSPIVSMPPPTTIGSVTSGSFRLQPRGRTASSPFSAASSSRGRKRSAQCLSTSSAATVVSGGALRNGEESLASATDSPGTQSGEHPAVELCMQSLSIKSPRVHRTHMDFNTSPSILPSAPSKSVMGSSFISYVSSPITGPSYLRPGGDSIGSNGSSKMHSTSPQSSTKSSPRFAPLTVLHNAGPNETPTKRPPLHGRPSAMMFSLDLSSHRGGSDEHHEAPGTPTVLPAAVACSPPMSTASSITKDFTPARPKRNACPSTPEHIPAMASPTAMGARQMSPATPASRTSVRSAHDTPLPTVKLTPRSTPRSAGSNNRDAAMRTSPLSARDLGLLPLELVIDRSMDSTMQPSSDIPLPGNAARAQSPPYLPPPPPPPARPRQSYLPFPDWCDDAPPTRSLFQSYRLPPRDPFRTGTNLESRTSDGEAIPQVRTMSLLSPPASGGFLENMIREQERAAAMDADGSLSDPDEDEPFVLTDPALLAEERQSFGPARQRQRLSYNSLDQNNPRASSMSLASAHTSNASLLGVDFIRGDSVVSLSRHNLGNTSRNFSFKMDAPSETYEEPCGPAFGLGPNNRRQSDNSLSSIGLALDPPPESFRDVEGRDLVTPPVMENSALCPPLSHGDQGRSPMRAAHAHSVRISSSHPAAVSETISMMAYQSGHNHKLSPQMECPS